MKKASTQYITKIASGIFKTSLLISVFFALDKVLGLIRQILLAKSIGISKIADAFYAANNIPDAITTLVAGGVTLAFIPVLAQSIAQEDTPQTWRLFNTIFNLSLLFMFVCSLMVWLGSDVLVSAPWGVAPGLDKPTQDTTSSLMRLNLIASIFFTASGLIMATLQAHKRFFLTLLAPLIYTLVQILAILFFSTDRRLTHCKHHTTHRWMGYLRPYIRSNFKLSSASEHSITRTTKTRMALAISHR